MQNALHKLTKNLSFVIRLHDPTTTLREALTWQSKRFGTTPCLHCMMQPVGSYR